MKTITEETAKAFVIKLRHKKDELFKQEVFCKNHKFDFEAQIFRMKQDFLSEIIFDMENSLSLGFVWDKSLDNN